ncbi:hypothetical protein B0J13DRAFT_525880 [Dactylonectria estremocensis]|uniref:Uncharacterized protein n=1 Tax=Dactylonectria estremocensis TaxID=1079267 RepID=A0A9P9ET80_9HYPO|nr:hypothetical protein B0J13DRAFT_525880 [Dactylonectria estremocensis]
MSNPEVNQTLPVFVSSNRSSCPYFYFLHIVDPEEATLTVQVIGPNLLFKFTHSRAKALFPLSHITARLIAKTVGFLALVTPAGERLVLTAAQSGHGARGGGDMLDAGPGVLANLVWTRRVIAVGRLLGMRMERPFDNPRGGRVAALDGVFQGSHVEVKLAVHGIMVLLRMFNITKDFDNVTLRHLESLQDHCNACLSLVRRLEEVTGVKIRLVWKPRVELKQYENRCPRVVRSGRSQQATEVPDIEEGLEFGDDELSEEDSDTETVGGEDHDDVQAIPMIDLTSQPAFSPSPATTTAADPVDDYIDGLAYRVGQMESSPDGAAEAIVQFAQKMKGRGQGIQ